MKQLTEILPDSFFSFLNTNFNLIYNFIDQSNTGHELNVLLLDLLIDDEGKPTPNVQLQTIDQSKIYPPNHTFQGNKFMLQGFHLNSSNSNQMSIENMLQYSLDNYNAKKISKPHNIPL
jgi:hypothetical protein